MQSLDDLFADYSQHHQSAGNKLCHRIGIPVIMLSLLGMLARVVLWRGNELRIDLALVLIALVSVFYLRLDLKLGGLMIIASIAMYALGAWLPMWVNVALFVVGWILQFVGHSVYEKRQPAFLKNLVHLLVGPLWLLSSIVPAARRRAPA